MTRWLLIPALTLFSLTALSDPAPLQKTEKAAGASPWDKSATITVPPGFVVEQVAGPPLVEHPLMACFDDQGRLYVAESAGKNLRAGDLLKNPPNRIRRLEDTNGDGKFDRSTIFADRMTFPMGVLWYRGALYSASPPSLWQLKDTDDNGIADQRKELVTRFGFTGNAADIHGPFLHPAGWIYWADGRHGHEIKRPDGKLLQGKAARIFRCRPDGSQVEVVCGGGMDNPVEVAFTPEGEALTNVNIFLNRPRMDAIIHCIEGGAFPWHQVHGEFKRTGELLSSVTELGWVATSGLMRYRSMALGEQYQGALFSTLFNRHRVQWHPLKRAGATFEAANKDFLTSSDHDFHPTDVLEDADGSLLILDTGGWFRIGCPTSRIAKPQIKGGIYRVRRKDAPKIEDPRGLEIQWDKLSTDSLLSLFTDSRVAVRDRAIDAMALRGEKAIAVLGKALRSSDSVQMRRNAVWCLARLGSDQALAEARRGLKDQSDSVKLAAVHVLGLLRDQKALKELLPVLKSESLALRREAATALGRLGRERAVPELLAAMAKKTDRFLDHALIYALIVIGDQEGTAQGLKLKSPRSQRGALMALEQMSGAKLTLSQVAPFLKADDEPLQEAALKIFTRNPQWAKGAYDLLQKALSSPDQIRTSREVLQRALIAFAKDRAIQALMAKLLQGEASKEAKQLILESMAQVSLKPWPDTWKAAVKEAIASEEATVVHSALVVAQSISGTDFDPEIRKVIQDGKRPTPVRVAAMAAMAPRLKSPEAIDFLLGQLQPRVAIMDRLRAAKVVSELRLNDRQLQQLTAIVSQSGPLELPYLLPPFAHSKSSGVGKRLLVALEKAPGFGSLSEQALRGLLEGYPTEVKKNGMPLLRKLAGRAAEQQKKLQRLQSSLKGGDSGRGRSLFYGKKAACAACHAVKGQGATIGPDLSTIGAIRSGTDLLESIVVPSSSLARGYESYVVTTRQGKVLTGTLGRETSDAVYLVNADREEKRVPRGAIESIHRSEVSLMPSGLDEQLSLDEIRDLMAYLFSLR